MTLKGSLRAFIWQSPDGVTSDIWFNRAIWMSTKKMVCEVESIIEGDELNPFPINTKFTLRIKDNDYVVYIEDTKENWKVSYFIIMQIELKNWGEWKIDLRMPWKSQRHAIEKVREYLDLIGDIIK